MTCTKSNIVSNGVAVNKRCISKVTSVGIHTKIRAIDKAYIVHGLLDRIHKRSLHGLKAHNNARLSSHFYSLCQILLKVLTRILCAVLVVHVIASKLNGMKPQVTCKVKCLLHNLKATLTSSLIARTKRILAVTRKAHRAQANARVYHCLTNCCTLLTSPLKARKTSVRLINGDLNIIKARLSCYAEALFPRKISWSGLLVKS